MSKHHWNAYHEIVVCGVLADIGWQPLPQGDWQVRKLAELIGAPANSVSWKMANLRSARPGHNGAATHASKTSKAVAALFDADPGGMATAKLRTIIRNASRKS
jgi:hypothetical protein